MNSAAAAPARIGVFDSGAGGLSIVPAVRAALPGLPIVYYADTAFAPYGPRSDQQILERTQFCCKRLTERQVSALVVACNTATANAIDAVRGWATVPVVGIEPGLKPAAAETRNGAVGVLATQATLSSRRYRDLAARVGALAPNVRFVEHAARGWVELVESGDLDSPQAHALVQAALDPLLAQDVDTIVLGCTHYPFLRAAIEARAPGVTLIETGPAVARELQRRLGAGAATADPVARPAGVDFESSADTQRFCALAQRLLGGFA